MSALTIRRVKLSAEEGRALIAKLGRDLGKKGGGRRRSNEDRKGLFLDALRKAGWGTSIVEGGAALLPPGWSIPIRAESEYVFAPPRKWRFDWILFYRGAGGAGLAIEVNGGRGAMAGRHASDEDGWKRCEAVSRGWRLLEFTTGMLRRDPLRCIALLERTLGIERPGDGR